MRSFLPLSPYVNTNIFRFYLCISCFSTISYHIFYIHIFITTFFVVCFTTPLFLLTVPQSFCYFYSFYICTYFLTIFNVAVIILLLFTLSLIYNNLFFIYFFTLLLSFHLIFTIYSFILFVSVLLYLDLCLFLAV